MRTTKRQSRQPVRQAQALQPPARSSGPHAKGFSLPLGNQAVQRALAAGGRPLDRETRACMEPRFGRNFSRVRVHTGTEADSAARRLNARAFTVGRAVAFAAGQYNPATTDGKRLLAHELTHVLQQASMSTSPDLLQRSAAEFRTVPHAGYRPEMATYVDNLLALPEDARKLQILEIKDLAFLYELREALADQVPEGTGQQATLAAVFELVSGQVAYLASLPQGTRAQVAEASLELLSSLLVKINTARAKTIKLSDLERLRTGQLELVLERTQQVAAEPSKEGRIALEFLRYTLIPFLQRRAGFETRFAPEVGGEMRSTYAGEKGGLRCLAVVHKGLKALLPPEVVSQAATETTREGMEIRAERRKKGVQKKGNIVHGTITLSRFMGKLQEQGLAGPETKLERDPRTKKWRPDPQEHLLKLSQTTEPGWFFFAVSMHSFHTGVFAVDRTDVAAPKIYWLDQFAGKKDEGFDRELTGKIEVLFREFTPKFGFAPTKIWPIFVPESLTGQECVVDDTK